MTVSSALSRGARTKYGPDYFVRQIYVKTGVFALALITRNHQLIFWYVVESRPQQYLPHFGVVTNRARQVHRKCTRAIRYAETYIAGIAQLVEQLICNQ